MITTFLSISRAKSTKVYFQNFLFHEIFFNGECHPLWVIISAYCSGGPLFKFRNHDFEEFFKIVKTHFTLTQMVSP